MDSSSSNDNGDVYEKKLQFLFRNISTALNKLNEEKSTETVGHDDSGNAYLYILFVLTFYACSIVVLMVKYIRREREGSKLEYYYNEFVKRDWYKDKNLYDNRGRRIHYSVDGTKVVANKRQSRTFIEDPGMVQDLASVPENGLLGPKKSVILCLDTAETALALVSKRSLDDGYCIVDGGDKQFINTGARPKRSALKHHNDDVEDVVLEDKRRRSFQQQSLEEALELRNVASLEGNLCSPYKVAKKFDTQLVCVPDDKCVYDIEEDPTMAFLPPKNKLVFTKIDK